MLGKKPPQSEVAENTEKINLPKGLTTYTYGPIISDEMITKVVVTELKCNRCNHKWIARRPQPPKVCPNCKRQDWNDWRGPKAKTA